MSLIINTKARMEHVNPPLIKGHTYQLVANAGSSPEYSEGSVFAVGYNEVVWLTNDKGAKGGYDSVRSIKAGNFKFMEVDLTLA